MLRRPTAAPRPSCRLPVLACLGALIATIAPAGFAAASLRPDPGTTAPATTARPAPLQLAASPTGSTGPAGAAVVLASLGRSFGVATALPVGIAPVGAAAGITAHLGVPPPTPERRPPRPARVAVPTAAIMIDVFASLTAPRYRPLRRPATGTLTPLAPPLTPTAGIATSITVAGAIGGRG